MSPADAGRAARLQFGGLTQLREYHRDARGIPFVESWLRDLRFGLRMLRTSLGFSSIAIAVLALGIGAATAIYSVAKAVIFAPLPFAKPDRLVHIFEGSADARYQPGGENIMSSVRNGVFQDWLEQARCFDDMAAVNKAQSILMVGDRTFVVDTFLAGDGFFKTLGVPARLGRVFMPADYAEGSRVVVLADRIWREQFDADPSIVAREVVLDGASYRVVGVMPPGFLPTRNERDPQVWFPLRWDPAAKFSRVLWGNAIYARLKDGVTLQQAQSEMDRVAAQIRTAHPGDGGRGIVVPLDGYLFGYHERMFVLLLAAVGLVLLIACANVANLLLARALERQREFAMRSALGASRGAILRQVLAESLVVACAGGLLGAALSPLLTRSTRALLPLASKIPRLDEVRLDAGVLLFSLVISIFAGLLFGVAPAIRTTRVDLSSALRSGGRGLSAGRHEGRLGDALVVAEVALSLVLLVGGGLLARAFLKLLHTDPGFQPAQSVALQLSIPLRRYGEYELGGKNLSRQHLYSRLEQTVQSLADVETVGLSQKLPLRQIWNPYGIGIEGRAPVFSPNGSGPMINKRWGFPMHGSVSIQTVSPGYFASLGIPLLRGRTFDSRDRADTPMAAMINQAMAKKFFPGEEPVGQRIAIDMTGFALHLTIVGMVGDSRLDGIDKAALPEVFWPMTQLPSSNAWLIARAKGDASSIGNALRQVVHGIDPEIGIVELSTMTSVLGDSLWRERFSALLIGFFAMLASLIAVGGLYAVISHAVERRTHELGVRLAIGANAAQIARTVLGHGLRITAMGIVVGVLLTMATGRLLALQAYRVSDLPWMLAAVAGGLVAITLLACWVPVRRALAVDPVMALRAE
jgi:putative ABC transport system permease protein